MLKNFSQLLDKISGYLAPRKGLLPIIGMVLIILNYLLQFFFQGWMVRTDLLLHGGVLIAILGFMIA